jgi:spermidine/putrescine transport system substrate-binding protein
MRTSLLYFGFGLGLVCLSACTPTATPTPGGLSLTLTPMPTSAITPHPSKTELEAKLGWTCPDDVSGQTLHIATWSNYVAPDTLSNFEALCGVTIDAKIYSTNQELFDWLSRGEVLDVVIPSSSFVPRMRDRGMLYPIRQDLIPNRTNLNKTLTNLTYDPENRYTIPYLWGTTGLAYNADKTSQPITTWQEFFDYDGPVGWLDEYRPMLNIALYMAGFKPNSANPDEIRAAKQFLLEHLDNVAALGSLATREAMIAGTIDAGVLYSGSASILARTCACYQYVLPEGASIWIDNLVIPINAPNKHLGEAFINYILLPQVAADIANTTFFATPNRAALDQELLTPDLLTSPIIYPPEDRMNHLFFTMSVSQETQTLYDQVWKDVLAAFEAQHSEQSQDS